MRRVTTKQLKVPVIVLLVFSMTLITMLTEPVAFPLTVKMSDDKTVNIAMEMLKNNGLNTIVVTYNSPMYHLLIWRACAGVIWIGHGLQQGIKTHTGTMPWPKLASEILLTPSKDIILSCESANLKKYVDSIRGIYISRHSRCKSRKLNSVISADWSEKFLERAVDIIINIMNGIVSFTPLSIYYVGNSYIEWPIYVERPPYPSWVSVGSSVPSFHIYLEPAVAIDVGMAAFGGVADAFLGAIINAIYWTMYMA